MRSLGRVSYGIYIFHLPIFILATVLLGRMYVHFQVRHLKGVITGIVTILLTVLVSYASFYCYERRFLLLKNRFTSIEGAKDKQAVAHPF